MIRRSRNLVTRIGNIKLRVPRDLGSLSGVEFVVSDGHALPAVLWGACHNLRMILRAIRLGFVVLLTELLGLYSLNKPKIRDPLQP
ncbi:MAG: hypothetical protein FAZ92_00751 [Accumulibacter sp.]|nr:MAG: hypothetical protein FAZ92_00751 [Accumulibacter sp.]